jgi:hypothetical protein
LTDEVEVHRGQVRHPELFWRRTLSPVEGLQVTFAGLTAINPRAGVIFDGKVVELLMVPGAAEGTLHPVARPRRVAGGAEKMAAALLVDLPHCGTVSAGRAVGLTPAVEVKDRADLEGPAFDERSHAGPGQEMEEADG